MPPPDDRYDDDRTGDRRDDDRGADRPRRDYRDDGPPPKKKSNALLITLIAVGGVLLVCGGVCGGCGYWSYSLGKAGEAAADAEVKKVGAGDLTAAYNGMSSSYKASHTQEQFTDAMKQAKLDDAQSVAWGPPQQQPTAGQGAMSFPGTVTLKSGGSTTVTATVRLLPDLKTWEVDNLASP